MTTSSSCADGVWHGLRFAPGALAQDLAANAVVVQQGRMAWVGEMATLPADYRTLPHFDGAGALVPGGPPAPPRGRLAHD